MKIATLTRTLTFCASHRLHSSELSAEENRNLYGKCNWDNGHGHNYTLEVSVTGRVDKKTGMVMNITDLKKVLAEIIHARVDHKHLNLDVPELEGINPTTENLAIAFYDWLFHALPKSLEISLTLWETEKNKVTYSGRV